MDFLGRIFLAATTLLFAPFAGAAGQTLERSSALCQEPDGSPGTLTKIWITARDSGGKPVLDLKKQDLRPYEDKAERQVLALAGRDSERLTVGLLIDASMKRFLPFFRPKLTGAGKLFGPVLAAGGQGFVAVFGDSLSASVVTSDRFILEHLVRYQYGKWLGVRTALFDSVRTLCESKFPDGRRALVIVSNGNDTSGRALVGDALRSAELTRTQIFFLFTLPKWEQRFERSQTWMLDARIAASRLSSATGGKFFQVDTDADADSAFQEIASSLASQYALTICSVGPGPHKIKMKSLRSGVRIVTQEEYPASRR